MTGGGPLAVAPTAGPGEAARVLAAATGGLPWGLWDAEAAAWLAGCAPILAVTVASWLDRARTGREEG